MSITYPPHRRLFDKCGAKKVVGWASMFVKCLADWRHFLVSKRLVMWIWENLNPDKKNGKINTQIVNWKTFTMSIIYKRVKYTIKISFAEYFKIILFTYRATLYRNLRVRRREGKGLILIFYGVCLLIGENIYKYVQNGCNFDTHCVHIYIYG